MDYRNYLTNNLNHIKGIEQSNFNLKVEIDSCLEICSRFNLNGDIFRSIENKLNYTGNYNLGRDEIIKLIKSEKYSIKEKIVLILSWGIYL